MAAPFCPPLSDVKRTFFVHQLLRYRSGLHILIFHGLYLTDNLILCRSLEKRKNMFVTHCLIYKQNIRKFLMAPKGIGQQVISFRILDDKTID